LSDTSQRTADESVDDSGQVRVQVTSLGAATTFGGAGLLFLAATSGQPALVTAGALLLGLVAFARARAAVQSRRLRALSFSWATPASVRRNQPFELVAQVVHSGDTPLTGVHARVVGDGASSISSEVLLDVPRGARGTLGFTCVLPVAGQTVVQGVDLLWRDRLGLVGAVVWQPAEQVLRADAGSVSPARPVRLLRFAGLVPDRDGRRTARRRGGGVELRELRDYVPGDPLRSVAWKATARRQRPLVRMTEDDTRRHLQVLVDIGPSMRRGDDGARPLDEALDLAAAVLQAAALDRVGLTLFDTRIYAHLAAKPGAVEARRRRQTLLDATLVVDEDLTEATESEVLALVATRLERRSPSLFARAWADEGIPLARLGVVDPLREVVDESAVHTAVARHLIVERARARALLASRARPARDLSGARLRLACALLGVPLPYRCAPDPVGRNAAFADALLRGETAGAPESLLVLSDLAGLSVAGPALRAVQLLRHKKRKVVLVAPRGGFVGDPEPWRRAGAKLDLAGISG